MLVATSTRNLFFCGKMLQKSGLSWCGHYEYYIFYSIIPFVWRQKSKKGSGAVDQLKAGFRDILGSELSLLSLCSQIHPKASAAETIWFWDSCASHSQFLLLIAPFWLVWSLNYSFYSEIKSRYSWFPSFMLGWLISGLGSLLLLFFLLVSPSPSCSFVLLPNIQ